MSKKVDAEEQAIREKAFVAASKALFEFWGQLGKGKVCSDPAAAYEEMLNEAMNAEGNMELIRACVAEEDWDGGLSDVVGELSRAKVSKFRRELAPKGQPTVPLPFQGNLLGVEDANRPQSPRGFNVTKGLTAPGPKMVVLTSNPRTDKVIDESKDSPERKNPSIVKSSATLLNQFLLAV